MKTLQKEAPALLYFSVFNISVFCCCCFFNRDTLWWMHRGGGWWRVSLLDNNSPCSLQCGWGFQSALAEPMASPKFLRGGAWLYLLPSGETNPPPVHLLPFSFLLPAHSLSLLSPRELLPARVLLFSAAPTLRPCDFTVETAPSKFCSLTPGSCQRQGIVHPERCVCDHGRTE